MTITKDLLGRKSRHLHPKLREKIEEKLFGAGLLPKSFSDRDLPAMVCDVARAIESLHIREVGGNNRGQFVGMIQGIIGKYIPAGDGNAWCMSTDQCIVAFIEDYLQVESPVLDSESCVSVIEHAKQHPEILAPGAEVGCLWVAQHGTKWQGHTGTVLLVHDDGTMMTFEGNTGAQSIRDGDGAFIKTRNQKVNGDLVTRAFVYLYPNNKCPVGGPR